MQRSKEGQDPSRVRTPYLKRWTSNPGAAAAGMHVAWQQVVVCEVVATPPHLTCAPELLINPPSPDVGVKLRAAAANCVHHSAWHPT
jgi:hypothetical protein